MILPLAPQVHWVFIIHVSASPNLEELVPRSSGTDRRGRVLQSTIASPNTAAYDRHMNYLRATGVGCRGVEVRPHCCSEYSTTAPLSRLSSIWDHISDPSYQP